MDEHQANIVLQLERITYDHRHAPHNLCEYCIRLRDLNAALPQIQYDVPPRITPVIHDNTRIEFGERRARPPRG